MLKKRILSIRGYISVKTIIIVLILIATLYVFQNKYEEINNLSIIKNSRENGALFYLEGLWKNMKKIQRISEGRSQRAMELFEEVKLIKEKSGLFSLKIPKSWNVINEEGPDKKQISKIVIENSRFLQHNEDNQIYYDDGAQLVIQVVRGENKNTNLSDSPNDQMVVKTGNINVGSYKSKYNIIKDNNVKKGEIINAHVMHNGNIYNFQLVDNPSTFSNGEFSFQEILQSFQFLK
ncbi:MAG TPA: hypothetical protein P5548_00025 [Candidatus Moranbacteria bacterium]|nr:hypothetical protein [Candidatus Moranbacteria bacterium]HRZ33279.1 hypothetical protein [Candidatus Moranbacteria bacterium]